MAYTSTFAFYKTKESYLTKTSGSDAEIIGTLKDNITSASANAVLKGDRFFVEVGATATNSVSIWPASIAALATGTAIHFECLLTSGSTDTTAAARKVEIASGDAKVADMFCYGGQSTNLGRSFELDFSAVTTLTVERTVGGNEVIQVEVMWYVYTI
jgi:hypothetical protein